MTIKERIAVLEILDDELGRLENERKWHMVDDEDGNQREPVAEDGYNFTRYNAFAHVIKLLEKAARDI